MVILKVHDYSNANNILPIMLEDERCYCTHNQDGEDVLTFELDRAGDNYSYIQEEVLIEGFDNRFIVKKVEEQSDFVIVNCDLDFSDWLSDIFIDFRKTNINLPNVLSLILPNGWTVEYGAGVDVTTRTTVEQSEGMPFKAANAKTILGAISSVYGVVFNYDMLSNKLNVLNINAFVSSGDYFVEDLNISNLKFTGDSSGIVTRLYVYGKKNERTNKYLDIKSVNDGKEYLEDYTYTSKVISDSIVDERFTVPEHLKAYGESVLAEKCLPSRSYTFDVLNLAGEMYIYKVVTLIDKKRKLRLNHQCVKYVEYNDHSLDKITLSSIAPTIETLVGGAVSNQASVDSKVQAINDSIQSMEGLIIGSGGNFKWVLNSDGDKAEFLILVDSDSIGTATKLFKLDNTGLYYSSTGYDGEYTTLINQNGMIVGAQTTYSGLTGKPTIEGVTIDGNQTFADWGLTSLTNLEIDDAIANIPVQSLIKYVDNIGVNYLYNVIKRYIDSVVLSGTVLTTIDYLITTVTNSNVLPWGAFRAINISQDIANYGTPISIIPEALTNGNPVSALMSGSNLNVYSRIDATDIPVKVTFKKDTT